MTMDAKTRENLLIMCNKFGFATLNTLHIGPKRCVLVFSWF